MTSTQVGPRWIGFLLSSLLVLWGIPGVAIAGDLTLSSPTRGSTLSEAGDSRTKAAVVKLHGCDGNLSTAFAVAVDQGTTEGKPGGKGLYLVVALHAVAYVEKIASETSVTPCEHLRIEVGYRKDTYPVVVIANRPDDDLALLLLDDRTQLKQALLPLALPDENFFITLQKELPYQNVRQLGYDLRQAEVTPRLGQVVRVEGFPEHTRIAADYDAGPGKAGDSGGAVVNSDGYLVGVYVGAGQGGTSALVGGDIVHAMVKERLGVLATPTLGGVMGVWVARVEGDEGGTQQKAFTHAIEKALGSGTRGSRFEVRDLGQVIRGTGSEVEKVSLELGAMANAAVVVAISPWTDRLGEKQVTTYVTAIPREVPYRACTGVECSYQDMKRFQSLKLIATDEAAVTLTAKGTLGFVLMAEGLYHGRSEPEYDARLMDAVRVLEDVLTGFLEHAETLEGAAPRGGDVLGAVGGELAVREALGDLYWYLSEGSLSLQGKEGYKAAFLKEAIEHSRRVIALLELQGAPMGGPGLTDEVQRELAWRWTVVQNKLALALTNLPTGDRCQNLQQAIDAYRLALSVYAREAFPGYWAMAQKNLGIALQNLPTGDRAQNLQQAIDAYHQALTISTRETLPVEWAATQNNLGTALQSLYTGDRSQNLRLAIDAYRLALSIFTHAAFPVEWAQVQNNLGTTLVDLPTGDRAQNLQQAIDAYRLALTVYTREAFPEHWALTQNNLGTALQDLRTGDPGQNIQRAIDAYRLALIVYTREAFPEYWAMTQNNLGNALLIVPTGDRAHNIQQAIEAYRLALAVRTREAFPEYWAMTQNNLGDAFYMLPTGDRAQNLEQAIEAIRLALTVYTREAFPEYWAITQNNLGNALQDLPTGDRAQNLEQAIQAYRLALTVNSRDSFPDMHTLSSRSLVIATLRLMAYENHGSDPDSSLVPAFNAVISLLEGETLMMPITSDEGSDPISKAINALVTAAELNADEVVVLRYLAEGLWIADFHDEAIKAQRRSVKLAPDNEEYRAQLKTMKKARRHERVGRG